MKNIYELSFRDTTGATRLMSEFQGKVLLIVNTATRCGLAPQFVELEKLHQKYRDQGLVVIGFPCDQFQHQEPETNETMAQVCQVNFGVTFLLAEKISVNGPDTHPVFVYLKNSVRTWWFKHIKWNFTKFLVNKQGIPVARFAPIFLPQNIESSIQKLLSE